MIYTLMNKHIPLADINFSSLGHIDEICKVYTPEAFPVGIITKDSSNGWLKKKWVIINDKRYLAKAGSGTLHQEPYNEVAISKILDLLKIKHIEYKTIMENNRPLCLCENFINPNTEFVPANLIYNVLPQKNNESNLTHFFKCAEYLQISGTKDYINNFLTIDYLTENTDRHYGNFGFIRNINTLKFISPAPIFDNGTSLWNNCLDSEIGEWQSCMPFKKNHREQIKLVTSFNISEQSLCARG